MSLLSLLIMQLMSDVQILNCGFCNDYFHGLCDSCLFFKYVLMCMLRSKVWRSFAELVFIIVYMQAAARLPVLD